MISPKASAVINIIIAVLGAAGAASADLTTLWGSGVASEVVTYASLAVTILSAINAGLHGVSGPQPGPLVDSAKK